MFLPIKQICPEYDGKNFSNLERGMDHFAIPVRSFETLKGKFLPKQLSHQNQDQNWEISVLCPKFFWGDARFFSAVFHLRQIGRKTTSSGKYILIEIFAMIFFELPENSTTGTTLAKNDVHDDDMSNIYDSPKVPPIPVVMNSAVAELPTNQPHHDNNNCNTKSLYINHLLRYL